MFNERAALKNRLEQLIIMEEKTINMYKEERKEIFDRLRELDNQEESSSLEQSISGPKDQKDNSYNIFPGLNSSSIDEDDEEIMRKKRYHKKTLPLRNATINILKSYPTAITLQQLKKELKAETGIEMKNISLFMTNLIKKEANIKKVTHGQYMYIEKQ